MRGIHIWSFLLLAICAIPPALIVNHILTYGVNVPYYDDWDATYTVVTHTAEGTLTLADFFPQHNQHRVVFSRVAAAFNTLLTRWDIRVEMLLSVVLALGTWGVVTRLFHRDHRAPVAAFAIGFSLIVFAYRQKQNWLMALQTSFNFPSLFITLALLVLRESRVGWRPQLIAAALATCATFSTLSGAVAWVTIPIALFLLGYRRPRHYLVWGGIAALVMLLYFTDYRLDTGTATVRTIDNLARFSFAMLGGAFVPESPEWIDSAVRLGIGGVVLAAVLIGYLWRTRRDPVRLAVWLSLMTYALVGALLTAFGRVSDFQPLSGRYITSTVFFWGVVLALALETLWTLSRADRLRPLHAAFAAVLSIAFAVYGYQYVVTNQWAERLPYGPHESDQACVYNFVLTDQGECLDRLYPPPAAPYLEDRIRTLWRLGLSTFAATGVQPIGELPGIDALGIDLTLYPFLALTRQPDTRITTYTVVGQPPIPAIFQHPAAQIAFTIAIPADADGAVFTTSVIVDESNLESSPDMPQDGVLFRVTASDADPTTADLTIQQAYAPDAMDAPVPLRLELGTFAGERITLILETDPRGNANFDWALWLDPRLVWSPS